MVEVTVPNIATQNKIWSNRLISPLHTLRRNPERYVNPQYSSLSQATHALTPTARTSPPTPSKAVAFAVFSITQPKDTTKSPVISTRPSLLLLPCLYPNHLDLRHHHRPPHRNQPHPWLLLLLHPRQHLRPNVVHEPLHLPVHLLHSLPHLQHNCNPRNIHPQIPRQVQNKLQPFQIFIGIKTCIPFTPRGPQQTLPLIQAQRLRMNLIHLRHRRNHVRALALPLRSHLPTS